jgi:hypothetical protein
MAWTDKLADFLRLNDGEQAYTGYPQMQVGLTKPRQAGYATGFLEGATGADSMQPKNPITDPNYDKYAQGKNIGEAVGIGAMAIPAYAMALRASAPKAAQMVEKHLTNIGGINHIVPPSVANEMGMATTLPKDDIFTQAVANTPAARMSEEGLHLNLMRKQKPEQAMTESVRSGVFYLPEGSSSMKHYGGTNFYGGTDKITGETLYKNPLFVKGATGGKAPEAAYAQLTDKDQLKQMLDDAMEHSSFGFRPNISYGQQTQKVEEFLSKYAPDLEGYASYIVDNSKRGNQLRYALQEAATAQKVRDAGYDAVIGHSKGKQGPFISEIFDVRESHYPNQYGDFQLNPKFEEMYQNAPRRDLIQQQIDKIE